MSADQNTGSAEKPDEPKRARGGLMVIDDGYTLIADIVDVRDDGKPGRPKVTLWYRPATPDEVYEYQIQLGKIITGVEKLKVQSDFLDEHVVKWSGLFRGDAPVEWKKGIIASDKGVRRGLGTQYLSSMLNFVGGYDMGRWEQDEKNS